MCKINSSANAEIVAMRSSFNSTLQRYRTHYQRSWDDRTTARKATCLNHAIDEKVNAIFTRDVFLMEYARRIDLLLDSTHFVEACKDKNMDPYCAATHIVVLGMKEVEDVILNEGYKTLHPYPEWRTAIFEKEELSDYLEERAA